MRGEERETQPDGALSRPVVICPLPSRSHGRLLMSVPPDATPQRTRAVTQIVLSQFGVPSAPSQEPLSGHHAVVECVPPQLGLDGRKPGSELGDPC